MRSKKMQTLSFLKATAKENAYKCKTAKYTGVVTQTQHVEVCGE